MGALGKRLAGGEPAAFAELYDLLADRLYHYLVVRLGSREDAEDVVQETFVRLARKRRRLAGVDDLTAYVFTVARHEAARFARRRGRAVAFWRSPKSDVLFRQGASDETRERETADWAAAAMARLTGDEREIVELKIYAGLTFRTIAELTGLPQGTAATRYRTALKRLREWCSRETS